MGSQLCDSPLPPASPSWKHLCSIVWWKIEYWLSLSSCTSSNSTVLNSSAWKVFRSSLFDVSRGKINFNICISLIDSECITWGKTNSKFPKHATRDFMFSRQSFSFEKSSPFEILLSFDEHQQPCKWRHDMGVGVVEWMTEYWAACDVAKVQ